MIECSVCHSKIASPNSKTISTAYYRHRSHVSSKTRFINVLLVGGDCVLVGLQARHKKVGEKSLLSISTLVQAARNNVLLAVPALLYAINNYLKFIMQLYFNPATVKMLSNLKVLVIAILLKMIMKWQFSIIQWEALVLLLIGISVIQLRSLPEGTTFGLPLATGAYLYTNFCYCSIPGISL